MKDQAIQLKLNIDADVEELAELTRQLRSEILCLEDVASVDFMSLGKDPEGSKALGAASIGSLLVTLTPACKMLTTLITAIQSWLSIREPSETARKLSTIILEIDGDKLEVANITSEERQHLINLWVDHHKK